MGPGVDPDVIELLPFLPNYELYYNVSFLGTDFCTHPTKQDCGFSPDPLTAVPGPGEYDIDRKELNRTSSRPTSSFVCPRTHPSAETITETPAPGSYELWHVQPQYVDKCGQVLRDPFFRSQTKRMASFIAKSDVPGPGEYDVDRGLASLKGALGIGAGGVKGSGTVVKRSGQQQQSGGRSKEEVDVTPGPGWYTPHQTNPPVRLSSSSCVFRSRTRRFIRGAATAAPGPAFYQPEPLGKKSFRWNANKQWV